ncbi:hypothetical protein QYE76_000835 [Lolium multiflorum]|uniref:Gnk2-homologous domain-containing protein n=1 Tax=Lolium multiflorum TaxID=4521 RepID=A0AAD8RKM8_LOLMU|nr:hypothetical protein QYE76_000788 [Lolium multiflorum]KAK1626515.1 hypothetical protein QYE76_000830 [Lolium multiflorum]KAK1626520.1 hypothetical protein QYE76_000835 [Lolium multiflorum]
MASHLLLLLVATLAVDLQSTQSSLLHPYQPRCSNTGNYTDGSQYKKNLDQLLAALPAWAGGNRWFYNGTVGAPGLAEDQVFGLIMCYADRDEAQCVDCLTRAPAGITQVCRGSRTVNANYGACLLRYSDTPFFESADITYDSDPDIALAVQDQEFFPPFTHYAQNMTSMAIARSQLMDELAGRAGDGDGDGDLALRIMSYSLPYTDSELHTAVIAGLAQCTRDLSPSECQRCISSYTKLVPQLFTNRSGGGIKGYSCYLRYQLGPFDITTPPDVPAATTPMPPGSALPSSRTSMPGTLHGFGHLVEKLQYWITRSSGSYCRTFVKTGLPTEDILSIEKTSSLTSRTHSTVSLLTVTILNGVTHLFPIYDEKVSGLEYDKPVEVNHADEQQQKGQQQACNKRWTRAMDAVTIVP